MKEGNETGKGRVNAFPTSELRESLPVPDFRTETGRETVM